jgi:hypothetical protein
MNDIDDVWSTSDDENKNEIESLILLDQRATERHLSQIRSSGFRDAHQLFMENEQLMQVGFDQAYESLVKIAFLCGQLKAICSNSARLQKDTAFLAKLNDKLDKIQTYSYETRLAWRVDEANRSVQIDSSDLKYFLKQNEDKLNSFKHQLISLEGTSSELGEQLNQLEMKNTSDDTNDQEEEAEMAKFQQLNDILETLNL